jgi:aerobic-type carbon monoxide dehydrogenase small subunit (CoxS/CutS family)
MRLTVNGTARTYDGDPNMPLLWYLRDDLALTGTKSRRSKGLARPAITRCRKHGPTRTCHSAAIVSRGR